MNKILHLFDQQYVLDLFNKEVLPLYPGFKEIQQIKIKPVKKNIWETTYHVVIEFLTVFLNANGEIVELPIYCSAHSNEPRKSSFAALSFLWQQGFNRSNLTVPRPLFFSDYFNGYFYRGVQGQNLYYYIRQQDHREIENIIPKAAAWFVKLHALPADQAKNFNEINSRVQTVIPGFEFILKKIQNDFPQYYQTYKKAFDFIGRKEKKFLSQDGNLRLIHGDAHPENVIKMSANTIAVIDFTDICLADFARDLGTFIQQLEFMAARKIEEREYLKKNRDLFLENYLTTAKIKLDDSLRQRINYYYSWTSLRTATFFLLKEPAEPARARGLLEKVIADLKIK
jgi:aminoglycoside phosphotransferase